MIMGTESFESRAVKRLAVGWMGDADDQAGPFLKRAAIKIDRAVFGDEPVRVRSGGHHARAGQKHGRDFAEPRFRHRRHGKNGFAAF